MNLSGLKHLHLSEGQITVYEAVLAIGLTGVSRIQEKVSMERRNIYDTLNKLIEKGLVSYTEEGGTRTYQATHPSNLKHLIEEQQHDLKEITDALPEIIMLWENTKPEIGARIFRGNEAIKSLLNELLEYPESFWIGGNSGVQDTPLKFFFLHWNERRIEHKHVFHDLVDHGKHLKGLEPDKLSEHKKQFYKRCELPPNLSSPMVTVIFGDKVAQILWSKRSFAFVMESEDIRDSFMRYFEHFWKEPY